jgi:hypothetical protein
MIFPDIPGANVKLAANRISVYNLKDTEKFLNLQPFFRIIFISSVILLKLWCM